MEGNTSNSPPFPSLATPSTGVAQGEARSELDAIVEAILNEKNAPEILPYRGELVQVLQQQVQKQEDSLEDLERDPKQEIRRMLFSLELKRIRYLLRLYLRTRLRKLETSAAHVLGDEAVMERLSSKEQQFTQDFFLMAGKHLKAAVLDQLPPDFQSVIKTHDTAEGNDMISHPALDTHVFCNMRADVGSIQLDQDQVLDMKAGDLFIIQYSTVASLVLSGKAVLV